ncbi:TldD/PmbA family protein [Salaquimonas pukyongi]|uniref:TldD/PmbA family protein n=1 Tax=Salaquimonas pukyongi TaxID=2712698 RepID=UPI00313D800F
MVQFESLEEDASRLVSAALKAGADQCDVVVTKGQSVGVSVREGKVENTGSAEGDDFYLRVFSGKRVATVSTNQVSDLAMVAERAVAMARVSPEDPFQDLAPREDLITEIPDLDLLESSPPDPARLQEAALEAEDAGLAVTGVSKSMGASAGWGISGFVLATSAGFSGSYARSGCSVSASMVSGDGDTMERDYDFSSAVHRGDLRSPAEIGRTAGERAVRRANPRKVDSGNYPVIFDRRLAGGLLASLLGAINAASVARKTSFLRDRLGEQIAASAITVTDDPLRKRGLGSRPFDGEGLACKPLVLVDKGQLTTWLLDGATARELDLQTNARASRSGSGTSPSSTNAWIANGSKSPQELARDIGTGFLCTETIGHGINMVTGDYSKGASGFWIENGKITHPVAEITIAGNLKDMFMAMTPANDLEFRGATNAPSLLIEGMTIGGK